jgi:hypothetical protein
LRHRVAIGETIRALVHQQLAPTKKSVRGMTPASVPPAQREKFVDLVLAELQSLHAGNVVRFGVSPLEFDAWAKSGRLVHASKK